MSDFEGLSDGELLRRYVETGLEEAFHLLARRHAGMVKATARRILGSDGQSDDVVQATFLVLVRKASKIREGVPLAGWLYRVAQRAAWNARTMKRRRSDHEARSATGEPTPTAEEQAMKSEFMEAVDAALVELPRRLSDAIIQVHLEGRTQAEAATELGVSQSTIAERLKDGADRLRQRLTRRGLALSVAALAGLLESTASAAASTKLPTDFLASLGSNPTPQVASIAKGVESAMFYSTLKMTIGVAAASLALATGVWVAVASGDEQEKPVEKVEAPKVEAKVWTRIDTFRKEHPEVAKFIAKFGRKQPREVRDLPRSAKIDDVKILGTISSFLNPFDGAEGGFGKFGKLSAKIQKQVDELRRTAPHAVLLEGSISVQATYEVPSAPAVEGAKAPIRGVWVAQILLEPTKITKLSAKEAAELAKKHIEHPIRRARFTERSIPIELDGVRVAIYQAHAHVLPDKRVRITMNSWFYPGENGPVTPYPPKSVTTELDGKTVTLTDASRPPRVSRVLKPTDPRGAQFRFEFAEGVVPKKGHFPVSVTFKDPKGKEVTREFVVNFP